VPSPHAPSSSAEQWTRNHNPLHNLKTIRSVRRAPRVPPPHVKLQSAEPCTCHRSPPHNTGGIAVRNVTCIVRGSELMRNWAGNPSLAIRHTCYEDLSGEPIISTAQSRRMPRGSSPAKQALDPQSSPVHPTSHTQVPLPQAPWLEQFPGQRGAPR
jgi:hypothetical protein